MKTPLRPGPETASALLITVFVTGFLTLLLGSFLYLTQYEYTAVDRSQLWNRAMIAAEAGIEEGLAMINRFAGTTTAIENWPERALLNGWTDASGGGGTIYRMQRTIGDAYYVTYITNTGSAPIIKATGYAYSQKTKSYVGRGVMVQHAGGSYFRGGVLAKRGINLTGNMAIDSFNSQDPAYSTGGQYDVLKRKDGGNVGTVVSNLASAIIGWGSADVRGQLATGPMSTISVGGSFSAGSSAWVDAGTSGIQPGWSRNDLNLTIPDAPALPTGTYTLLPAAGSVTLNASGGTARYYATSLYSMNSWDFLQITNGTVVIDARAGMKLNGQAQIKIAPNSKLIIYLGPADTHFNGGGVLNSTGYATNCIVYGKNTCTIVEVNGNAAFIGQIYAPYAQLQLNGTSDIIGSMVGDTFDIKGNFNFHYDESLSGPNNGSSLYRVIAWKEVDP